MRILVGLACVALVAFVGYFFWGEWQAGQRRDIADRQAMALSCTENSEARSAAILQEKGQAAAIAYNQECLEFLRDGRMPSR